PFERPASDHHSCSELDTAIARLPGKDRVAIVLRFYEGRTFSEVARAMGISEEAARKRVTRAIARMRQTMGASEQAFSTKLGSDPALVPTVASLSLKIAASPEQASPHARELARRQISRMSWISRATAAVGLAGAM